MDVHPDGSSFINDLVDFNTPNSPPVTFEVIGDNDPYPNNNGANSPSFPGGELDISSYNNSPFSAHSELSFDDDFDHPNSADFGLFSAGSNNHAPGYDPSEYDNPTGNSLLMFSDNDYLSSYQGGYGDYSSPGSSNGSQNEGIRSRASSVSSNHQQPQSHLSPHLQAQHLTRSPHIAVAQSFEGMSFHSPGWGNEPLPDHSPRQAQFPSDVQSRSLSPQRAQAKPQSPPKLLMPDDEVPTINAPDDGDGGAGPALRIVPATPVSGGGAMANDGGENFRHDNNLAPFSNNNNAQSWTPRHTPSPHPPDSDSGMDTSSGQYQNNYNSSSSQPQAGSSRLTNSNAFLFPGGNLPRTRSKSDGSLEPPSWDNAGLTSFDDSAIDDGTVSMSDVSPPNSSNSNSGRLNSNFSFGGSPTSPNNGTGNAFLSVENGSLRRSKSDSYGRGVGGGHRGSRSEDLRFGSVPGINIADSGTGQQSNIGGGQGNGLLFPPTAHSDFIQHQQEQRTQGPQFLLPRGHGHSYSYSGSGPSNIPNNPHYDIGLNLALPNLGAGMGLSPNNMGNGSIQRQGSPLGHMRRASSGSRSERGASSWGVSSSGMGGFDGGLGLSLGPGSNGGSNAGSISGSLRASPYPSPNVSPRGRYNELPPDSLDFGLLSGSTPGTTYGSHSRNGTPNMPPMGLPSLPTMGGPGMGKPMPSVVTVGGTNVPLVVSKPNVTTGRTAKASHNRRKQEATFVCPVPGCGSTFTRSFNLKGHIRSHNEEKPFLCHWPGCNKGFARQHDCKRHEQLHTNYRPFTCEGCQKPFARMDALNRHLRSEGGAECQRTLEQNGTLPPGVSSPKPSVKQSRGRAGSNSRNNNANNLQDSEPAKSLPIPITAKMGTGGRGDAMNWSSNTNMKMEESNWSMGVAL